MSTQLDAQTASHIDMMVAGWQPISSEKARLVAKLLLGTRQTSPVVRVRPEVVAVQNAEAVLADIRRAFKSALEGCRGCGISSSAHKHQEGYGAYHAFEELTPDDAIKVARVFKKKVAAAEAAVDSARAAL